MAENDTPSLSSDAKMLFEIETAKDIVCAYVSNNNLPAADLPSLIAKVTAAVRAGEFSEVAAAPGGGSVASEAPKPAVEVRKSITKEALISFEDGKPYKTLRRHLTMRGLSPEQYRMKHGLPADYPMVAEGYSQRRSELAKQLGLGQQSRQDTDRAA